MSSLHTTLGYIAVVMNGIAGLWGVLMTRRDSVPVSFYWAIGIAIGGLLAQTVSGVILMSAGSDPGEQHVFYGVVIAVTFTFVYIYRGQFRRRPALYYGLLLLFTMGLGIRGIMTFGLDF